MDLQKITDQNQLKALAYDQMVTLEQTQNNLRLINTRIAELTQEAAPAEPAKSAK